MRRLAAISIDLSERVPSLLGRSREIDRLSRALRDQRKAGHVLILQGEPGVGKTALLRVAHELAGSFGYASVLVRAPGAGSLPLGFPLIQLLTGIETALADEGIQSPPMLRGITDPVSGHPGDNPRSPDLLETVAALDAAAGLSPIALLIDDLQWIAQDAQSILFSSLRAMEGRVLLVATLRVDPAGKANGGLWLETSADLLVDRFDLGVSTAIPVTSWRLTNYRFLHCRR